jgi:hypothetical protein
METLRNVAARSWRQVSEIGSVDLALRLTLLDLLLRPIGSWQIRAALLLLAGAGLLVPGWLRRPGLWFALAILTAVRSISDWPLADNHAYLISYWCLAIGLSLIARDTEGCLSFNGRLLIGLVFAFAVLWKLVLSADFLDGTFLRVTMLQDPRFEDWTRLSTGMSVDQLDAHRIALDRHLDAPPFEIEPGPNLPARFVWVAQLTTIWIAAIELAVAASFLLWWRSGALSRLRDTLLMAFCVTTYAVATVEGFGWLLISMGVAQCEPDRRKTRGFYLASFALILVYREVPWARLLAELTGT